MKIEVTNINVRREGGEVVGLQVYFNGRLGDQSINLNGYIPLAEGEFESHLDMPAIETAVRQKVVDRILSGESPTE
ncbi:hypothetical protein QNH23_06530 [Siminovitchia fortis]|uniref:Uncharacterized protein n=1 Tax=Siminovitchia fortis TaxID=254758 RepID=A0A443IMU1_9BACI|nr:hypothetical protein [Siminovitchia fortis]RWR06759.1 hypothetical protein D4N35_013925 [Siminovitchia fortis]WHY83028.1 hypothetical protein QNH23_06530 [Siminovitchia fortis]